MKEGILLVNKPRGKTSFSLVQAVRRRTGVRKVGHAGTLDPFAMGLVIVLVGRNYTRLSDKFLEADKTYRATLRLGIWTDSFDCDGRVLGTSDFIPSMEQVVDVFKEFQGEIKQTPPMFSAKKVNGTKLYTLARQGKEIERVPVTVSLTTTLLAYAYPYIEFSVECSKGTYIRSIGDEMGKKLGCGGHLVALERIRSGSFSLDGAIEGEVLYHGDSPLHEHFLSVASVFDSKN